jgi:hypothetical protein
VSLVSRVVHKLPTLPASSAAVFQRSGIPYDVSIGGLPFFTMPSRDIPIRRTTGEFHKDQVDTTNQPGEQSLASWWLRSQLSFHSGAGIKFEEPHVVYGNATDNLSEQFNASAGVNVWTQGQVTLLKKTTLDKSATGTCIVRGIQSAGSDAYLVSDGVNLYRVISGVATAITWGGTGTILAIVDDGTNYYVADNVGIWKGAIASGSGTKVWNTGSSLVTLGWVKQRLVAGVANKLYELADLTGAPTLPTARYTHPNTAWVWTAITEGPAAVYASGYAGTNSAIVKLALDASGNVPTLTSATVVDGIPAGEQVFSMYSYLGKYLAIGTSKGVRVAQLDASGFFSFGPLIFKTASASSPVTGMVGYGDFLWATYSNGIDTKSGLVRIDLGNPIDGQLQFAYATDLQSHVSGTVSSVALVGTSGRLVFGINTVGAYVEHATDLEPTGYLTTGYVRYHTLEPKLFKYIKVRAESVAGTINVAVVTPDGTATSVITYSDLTVGGLDEASLVGVVGTPTERIALTFTITRSPLDPSAGPVFTGYQLKALPAGVRPRNIVLPLMCFDKEERDDVKVNSPSFPRLLALEAMEQAGDEVLYQDFANGESRLVIVDKVDALQTASSQIRNSSSGFLIVVTLRTVT